MIEEKDTIRYLINEYSYVSVKISLPDHLKLSEEAGKLTTAEAADVLMVELETVTQTIKQQHWLNKNAA